MKGLQQSCQYVRNRKQVEIKSLNHDIDGEKESTSSDPGKENGTNLRA